jgi:branched-chain amino acid transport system substrate-binding protein
MRLIKQLLALAALVPGLAFAQAPIKVGIANDLSGPFAALGAEARDGFNLAIKELGGKLGGKPAEFLQTDMGGNPDQARQLVNRYIQRDKIDRPDRIKCGISRRSHLVCRKDSLSLQQPWPEPVCRRAV